MSNGSSNLGLAQLMAGTNDKPGFLNELLALIDSSVTSNLGVDGSASAILGQGAIQNYVKLTATNVPAGGSTLTLPQFAHLFILANDKASGGSVTYKLGTSSIVLAPGARTLAYLDGTANGLDNILSNGGTISLADLSDVDLSTPPTDGQALVFNAAAGKWKAGTVSSGGTNPPATSTKIVQHVATPNSGTAALPAAPTAGNLLVGIVNHYHNGAALPTGWTQLYDVGGGNDGVTIAYKVSDGSEQNITFGTNPPYSNAVWELSNVDPTTLVYADVLSSTAAVNINVPTNGIVLGLAATRGNSGPNNVPTAPNNATADDAGSANADRAVQSFHALPAQGNTAYQPTFSIPSGDAYTTVVAIHGKAAPTA